ncbi:TetR/AcrR family transcriptional regulator [Amycolatopsis rhizosphaerae]|uniref:TetR/AcrR family transcriptional regulator n=1 Tax=Amycolatopsis rhizosphaerae TaxID=2053003 RepID=A0A558DA00_9PSEU|nr:TetR/AcrR family transcriptional regulator [Amycolatopsis rhizosphaerae]TVT57842.1 TetR/AcrR family transcriptional regulator [Amycolatopsis rhizosphaerae]
MARRTDTRQRMLETAADLFHQQGYHATGLNQLVSAGGAPKGSLYFHFPGGKEQLAAEAVTVAAERLNERLKTLLAEAPDPGTAIERVVTALAEGLAASGFQRGCPIALVAMDAGATSEPIRGASCGGYASWQQTIAEYLEDRGTEAAQAEALSVIALSAIEGALLLARLNRDLAPLHTVGAHLRRTFTESEPS